MRRDEYVRIRKQYARGQEVKARASLQQARDNRFRPDPADRRPGAPSFLGVRAFDAWDLQDLADHIDWTPFFASWELIGRYPLILEDEIVGEAARDLFRDAQAMLRRIIDEKWFTARGVVGFWPSNSVGDDIELYTNETRTKRLATLHTLRQQMAREPGKPNIALADYVAPKDSGLADYVGKNVPTSLGQQVRVSLEEEDRRDAVELLSGGK